jgi:hypothetical protein
VNLADPNYVSQLVAVVKRLTHADLKNGSCGGDALRWLEVK